MSEWKRFIPICHVVTAGHPGVRLGISYTETATAWTASQIMNEVREQGMHAEGGGRRD